MGGKNWKFYLAYAVLVVGAGAALFMSERPLSATVVTWALFSFNIAAIVFIAPSFLDFIREIKAPSSDSKALREELSALRAQLAELADAPRGELVTLQDVLRQTAAEVPEASASRPLAEPPASLQEVTIRQSFAPSPPTPAAQTPPKPLQTSLFDSSTPAAAQSAANISETPTPPPPIPGSVSIAALARVGEDDVLCIRGEGGGLNWQEGIPMSYEEGDRWTYRVAETSTPITCRIYLNDEISAFGDDIILQPGQSLEVSPSFPQVEAT